MNKKILFSGLSIVSALTLMAGSAFAIFITTANANGNTFSSGTESLLISPDNSSPASYLQTITSPFTGTKITPGYNHVFTFYLKNDNTNSNDTLAVSASFTGNVADQAFEDALTTQFSCNDAGNITTAGAFSVTAMKTGSVGLGNILSGHIATCTMTVTLPTSAVNTLQNKTAQFNVVFNAGQPAS